MGFVGWIYTQRAIDTPILPETTMPLLTSLHSFARRTAAGLLAGAMYRVQPSTTSMTLTTAVERTTADATTSDGFYRNSVGREPRLPAHLRLGHTEAIEGYLSIAKDAADEGWTVVGVFLDEVLDELDQDLGPMAMTLHDLREQLRSGALRLTEQHIVMVGPDAIDENDHGHVEALLDDGLLLPNRLIFTPGNEETAAVLHHHVERKALQAVADRMAIETGRAARRRL